MKPVSVNSAPTLTADQARIIRLFTAMDNRRQEEMLRYAAAIAEAFPRCATPALHLVKGGAT